MMRWLSTCAVLAGGVAWAGELPPVDSPVKTALSVTDGALLVAIEAYPFLLGDSKRVPYAEADAEAFEEWLVYTRGLSPSRVKRLVGAPSREDIERAAREVAAKVPEGGTVWVYFAGHGGTRPKDGARALLPADVRPTGSSVDADGVSLDELYGWIGGGVGQVIAVVDACYTGAGRGGGTVLSGGTRFAVSLDDRTPPNVVEWVATGPGQLAQPLRPAGHGAFTYAVLGALRGWADGARGARDGKVTLEEAELYVRTTLDVLGVDDQDPHLTASAAQREAVLIAAGNLAPAPSESKLREAVGDLGRRTDAGGASGLVKPQVGSGPAFAVEDLDVASDLARQAAEQEAQREADALQEARLAEAVVALRAQATSEWSKLEPQLVACGLLVAGNPKRTACEAAAERFVAWAGSLRAEVSAGYEEIDTAVGRFSRAVAARAQEVSVPELAMAAKALLALRAKAPTSAPATSVVTILDGRAGSTRPIEVDGSVVGTGRWSGVLAPGSHAVSVGDVHRRLVVTDAVPVSWEAPSSPVWNRRTYRGLEIGGWLLGAAGVGVGAGTYATGAANPGGLETASGTEALRAANSAGWSAAIVGAVLGTVGSVFEGLSKRPVRGGTR